MALSVTDILSAGMYAVGSALGIANATREYNLFKSRFSSTVTPIPEQTPDAAEVTLAQTFGQGPFWKDFSQGLREVLPLTGGPGPRRNLGGNVAQAELVRVLTQKKTDARTSLLRANPTASPDDIAKAERDAVTFPDALKIVDEVVRPCLIHAFTQGDLERLINTAKATDAALEPDGTIAPEDDAYSKEHALAMAQWLVIAEADEDRKKPYSNLISDTTTNATTKQVTFIKNLISKINSDPVNIDENGKQKTVKELTPNQFAVSLVKNALGSGPIFHFLISTTPGKQALATLLGIAAADMATLNNDTLLFKLVDYLRDPVDAARLAALRTLINDSTGTAEEKAASLRELNILKRPPLHLLISTDARKQSLATLLGIAPADIATLNNDTVLLKLLDYVGYPLNSARLADVKKLIDDSGASADEQTAMLRELNVLDEARYRHLAASIQDDYLTPIPFGENKINDAAGQPLADYNVLRTAFINTAVTPLNITANTKIITDTEDAIAKNLNYRLDAANNPALAELGRLVRDWATPKGITFNEADNAKLAESIVQRIGEVDDAKFDDLFLSTALDQSAQQNQLKLLISTAAAKENLATALGVPAATLTESNLVSALRTGSAVPGVSAKVHSLIAALGTNAAIAKSQYNVLSSNTNLLESLIRNRDTLATALSIPAGPAGAPADSVLPASITEANLLGLLYSRSSNAGVKARVTALIEALPAADVPAGLSQYDTLLNPPPPITIRPQIKALANINHYYSQLAQRPATTKAMVDSAAHKARIDTLDKTKTEFTLKSGLYEQLQRRYQAVKGRYQIAIDAMEAVDPNSPAVAQAKTFMGQLDAYGEQLLRKKQGVDFIEPAVNREVEASNMISAIIFSLLPFGTSPTAELALGRTSADGNKHTISRVKDVADRNLWVHYTRTVTPEGNKIEIIGDVVSKNKLPSKKADTVSLANPLDPTASDVVISAPSEMMRNGADCFLYSINHGGKLNVDPVTGKGDMGLPRIMQNLSYLRICLADDPPRGIIANFFVAPLLAITSLTSDLIGLTLSATANYTIVPVLRLAALGMSSMGVGLRLLGSKMSNSIAAPTDAERTDLGDRLKSIWTDVTSAKIIPDHFKHESPFERAANFWKPASENATTLLEAGIVQFWYQKKSIEGTLAGSDVLSKKTQEQEAALKQVPGVNEIYKRLESPGGQIYLLEQTFQHRMADKEKGYTPDQKADAGLKQKNTTEVIQGLLREHTSHQENIHDDAVTNRRDLFTEPGSAAVAGAGTGPTNTVTFQPGGRR